MSRTAAGQNWGGSRLPTPERAAQPCRGWGPPGCAQRGTDLITLAPRRPRALPSPLQPERAKLLQLASAPPASPGQGAQKTSARTRRASPAFRTAPHAVVAVTAPKPQHTPDCPASPPSRAAGPYPGPSDAPSTLFPAQHPPSPWTPPVPPAPSHHGCSDR